MLLVFLRFFKKMFKKNAPGVYDVAFVCISVAEKVYERRDPAMVKGAKMLTFGRKGASPLMLLMFAVLVGIVILIVMNFRGASESPRTLSVQSQQASGGGQQGVLPINLVEDVTITFSAKDAADESVNVGGSHQYRICNAGGTCGSLKTVANLGTDTASPGDIIEVLFAQGNTTGSVVYLPIYKTFTLPDKGTFEAVSEVYRNGTITIEVFNEEGNLIDTAVENETLGAGDKPTLTHKIKGTQDRGQYFYGGCLIVEYNSSAYDNVVANYDGTSTRISTPDWYTESATAFTTKTYAVPSFINNQILSGSITPEVKTSPNPNDAGGDILLTLVPNEYRFNGDAKKFELFKCGEDQDGNLISNQRDSQFFRLNVD